MGRHFRPCSIGGDAYAHSVVSGAMFESGSALAVPVKYIPAPMPDVLRTESPAMECAVEGVDNDL